jgi:hypothetical protein
VGYAAAGPLLDYGGGLLALAVVAGLFFLAAVLNNLLPDLRGHLLSKEETLAQKLSIKRTWLMMKDGLNHLRADQLVWIVAVQVAFIFALERSVIALVPALAQDLLGFSIAQISFFMITPLGVGTVVGALVANRLKGRWRLETIIMVGLAVDALVLFLLPLYKSLSAVIFSLLRLNLGFVLLERLYVVALSFLSGLADVFIIISAQTLIQRRIASHVQGRVFANLYTLMNAVGLPLILIIALLADIINVLTVFVIFGLATLVMIAFGRWLLARKSKAPAV